MCQKLFALRKNFKIYYVTLVNKSSHRSMNGNFLRLGKTIQTSEFK